MRNRLCQNERRRRSSDMRQRILMLHSGGAPALFAYPEAIRAQIEKRGVSIGV